MDARKIDIDDFVDYEAEYSALIKDHKIQGDQLTGRCPFHDDREASFTANLKTGQCKCFCGCIGGNFISFWAKYYDTTTDEAYKQILEKYGKLGEPQTKTEKKKAKYQSYTVKEYALSKQLPEDFLMETCHLKSEKDSYGNYYVKMPYLDEDNKSKIFRKRYANKVMLWSRGSQGNLILYGEWRLPEIRRSGYAVLVEGESDTQTLWHMEIPALGCPGADVFNEAMVSSLQDLKLYVHIEPDQGGETFLDRVLHRLKDAGFIGEVYTWSCKQFGVKDPSELYMRDGKDEARAKIFEAVKSADKVDLDNLDEVIPPAIADAPVNLRRPEGWLYSEAGISFIDEKKMTPTLICRTPIILTKRLVSLENDEEKIEIAYKRDGEWKTAVYQRPTVFTSRGITELSELGCTVTSENAKQVVQFLGALEAENIDVIERVESTSTLGWQTKGRFLPGHGDGIYLDIDSSLRTWAAAYLKNGTFEGWVSLMRPHRDRDKFRFILAASFAAPLLEILNQRIFFVYNWGDSKGGKTAALKAALSAWGDPEHLMVNFNATQVALERMAGFFDDLPLGIDERQLAGKQGDLEKIIYMIASGTGRARGSKGGGLQELNTWRTVAIATGEEPLSSDTTMTGVATRVLEIYGGPFDDEKSASMMHQLAPLNCGWAGPYFVGKVMETDARSIQEAYEKITDEIYEFAGTTSGSHIAGIAAVSLADAMINDWIFDADADLSADPGDSSKNEPLAISQKSWDRALRMARSIVEEDREYGQRDVNKKAAEFIVDWVRSNQSQFGDNVVGQSYGFMEDNKANVFSTVLSQALSRAGYSSRKTMRYLADKEIIRTSVSADGSRKNSVVKKFAGQPTRFVEIDMDKLTDKKSLKEEDAGEEFMDVPDSDKGNPFGDENQEALPF